MKSLLSFAAVWVVVLAGGSVAQAQHFHGHAHYHRGHIHYHGHYHYPNSYAYPSYFDGSPAIYGSSWYTPTITYPAPVVNPAVIIPASATSFKSNALPPYSGPGVTLRLPAEYPDPVIVRIDKRDIELKPGTEVTLKEKPVYVVEFDRGGDYGAARHDLTEGLYTMTVGNKGWHVMLAPSNGGLPRNTLPGEPKK
ncbi:MAG: hypothetical protein K8U57_31025 [Planctomycetes bacterium]|nr:hypothetical protein [Planctomycetota bacterium]